MNYTLKFDFRSIEKMVRWRLCRLFISVYSILLKRTDSIKL